MWFYLLQGMTLALSATVMPGPYQAFLLAETLRIGWRRTWPAVLAPLVTDGPIIALVLLLLTHLPPLFLKLLQFLGGLFLLYLAWGILASLRQAELRAAAVKGQVRRTFWKAVAMNALNPNPYLFWSIVSGPILLAAWRTAPGLGLSFLFGFYGAFVASLTLLIGLFAGAGRFDARLNRVLRGLTGLGLTVFGAYQLWAGAGVLWSWAGAAG